MDHTNKHKSKIRNSDINKTNRRLLGRSQSLPATPTHQQSEKSELARRPRGGRKCIYMDSDEVKACKELGFELENDDEEVNGQDLYCRNLGRIITKSLSRQYSGITSWGDNSPIDDRLSNPGDDPREVKARLKVWAQAVALEATSQLPH